MVLKDRFKNNRGQAIVELAILLPVLLLILLGILEFGRIFSTYMTITHASREGARTGSVGGNNAQVESIIENNTPALDPDNMTITITNIGGERGETLTVIIGYDIDLMTPFIGSIVGDPLHLDAEMSMRIE